MAMSSRVRKLVLAIHVAISVGWLGAVAAYIPFDLVAATSDDPEKLRAAYLGMELIATSVIVPLAVAAVVTGVVVSLGTRWGLFRHYWVLISFVVTSVAAVVLLIEMQTVRFFAETAANPATTVGGLRALGNTLAHSIGGTIVLSAVLILNVYKPKGLTRYGWRRQNEQRAQRVS